MKKIFNNIKLNIIMIILALILLVFEIGSFAWLSTSWNGGDFSIKTTQALMPEFEMWTAYKDTNGNYVWSSKSGTPTTDSTSELKKINLEALHDLTKDKYVLKYNWSLYFGTINSLVQEQDNLPVYLKFVLTIPIETEISVDINYSLPTDENYLDLYLVSTTTDGTEQGTKLTDTDANENLVSTLNNQTNYPFLNLQWCYETIPSSDSRYENSGYTISSENTLDTAFVDLFENPATDSNLKNITAGSTLELTNNGSNTQKLCIYCKFNVPTETLQKALAKTELKSNMPVYLIFKTNFDIEVTSNGISNTTE